MSDHDEKVSQLERELRFFPVSTAHPRKLTPEQLRFYNEQGYLSGLRVFDQREVGQNRQKSDALLEKFIQEGKGSYAINRYQDRFATIYDLATAPSILDLVEDIVGPNIICWATHYFCKMPGDDMGVSWHQDCSYWALTPSKTVTVWLAIDDADREKRLHWLERAVEMYGWRLHAFVLMPNHEHLFVETPSEHLSAGTRQGIR